jgi:hypothetical protein
LIRRKFAVGLSVLILASHFDCVVNLKPFLRRGKITIMTFDWRNAATKFVAKNAETLKIW